MAVTGEEGGARVVAGMALEQFAERTRSGNNRPAQLDKTTPSVAVVRAESDHSINGATFESLESQVDGLVLSQSRFRIWLRRHGLVPSCLLEVAINR